MKPHYVWSWTANAWYNAYQDCFWSIERGGWVRWTATPDAMILERWPLLSAAVN